MRASSCTRAPLLLLAVVLLAVGFGGRLTSAQAHAASQPPPAGFLPPPCNVSDGALGLLPTWMMFTVPHVTCDPTTGLCGPTVVSSFPSDFVPGVSTYDIPLNLQNPSDGFSGDWSFVDWSLAFPITNRTSNGTNVEAWVWSSSISGWFPATNTLTPNVYTSTIEAYNEANGGWPNQYINGQHIAWKRTKTILLRLGNDTSRSCRLEFDVDVTCCSAIQPPQVVFQPYFILVLSSIAYFLGSYVWVFFLTILDRFICWRRCCWNIRQSLGRNENIVYRRVPRGEGKKHHPHRRASASLHPNEREMTPTRSFDPLKTPLLPDDHAHNPHASSGSKLYSSSVALSVAKVPADAAAAEGRSDHPFQQQNPPSPSRMGPISGRSRSGSDSIRKVSTSSYHEFKDGGIDHDDDAPLRGGGDDADDLIDPADLEDDDEPIGQVVSSASFHPDAVPVRTMAERLANANAGYLSFQFLVVFGNLIFLTLRCIWFDSAPTDADRSGWAIYQQIYLLWTNSSQVTLMSSAVASYLLLKYQVYATLESKGQLPAPSKQTWYGKLCCCLMCCCCCRCCSRVWQRLKVFWKLLPQSLATKRIAQMVLLLNLPIFVTHILPVWLLFFPLLVIVLLVLAFLALVVLGVLQLTQKGANKIFSLTSAGAVAAWDAVALAAKEYRVRKAAEEAAQRVRDEQWAREVLEEEEEKSNVSRIKAMFAHGLDELNTTASSDSEAAVSSTSSSAIPLPYSGPILLASGSGVDTHPLAGPSSEEQRIRLEELIEIAKAASQPDLPELGETAQVEAAAKVAEETMTDGRLATGGSTNDKEADLASASSSSSDVPKAVIVTVDFPWYAVLLLRLMCTICAVLLFQTCYNYGWLFWTKTYPNWSGYTSSWSDFYQGIYASIPSDEYTLRSSKSWWAGMEASFHQYLMQVSLFI